MAVAWSALGAAALWALPAAGAAHAQPAARAVAAPPADGAGALWDRGADAWTRKSAAAALLRSGDAASIRALLEGLADESGAGVREAVLAAVSEAWSPPARLFRPIVALLGSPRQVDAAAVMPAIAAYRTREAAGVLVAALSSKSVAGARGAAAAALWGMTGRDDLGSDYTAWSRWLAQVHGAGALAWRDALAEGVWRRAGRLEAESRATAGKLVPGYRQLYLALPAEPGTERARLLARIVADPTPELRDLGLDIVSRELSAGKSLDGSVGEAVLGLLRAGDPSVRERAAVLVMQLAPAGVGERVAAALGSETSAGAAAALMRAAARWPRPENVGPAIGWLERAAETREHACTLLLACEERWTLGDDASMRVLAALRSTELKDLSADGARLLALLGSDEDRTRLADLLTSGSPSQRIATAEALARYPEHSAAILSAAAKDPSLFESAVTAVLSGPVDAAAWEALATIPGPDEETRDAGLIAASAKMPMAELILAAERHEDSPELCELLLGRLAQMGVDARPRSGHPEPSLLVSGLVRLARGRLAAKRPALAIAALDTLPRPLPPGADQELIASVKTEALLWANQLELAEAEQAPVGAWLDGLERAVAEPHAPEILRRLQARFTSLTPEEQARLDAIVAKMPRAQTELDGAATKP
jgi:hypothetical protein